MKKSYRGSTVREKLKSKEKKICTHMHTHIHTDYTDKSIQRMRQEISTSCRRDNVLKDKARMFYC